MSSEVDERIVSMKFDNAQFEKNISKTSKSLEKFKKDLNFDGQEKSFRNLEKSINSANLDGLASAADRVSIKFNAMAAAGYASIQHIVDKAMNSTEALVKSLSVDQIASGWSKYAEKTGSVQTIMAATGADIQTVNAELKKLLWFADETSYSFTDMTNGIGKFTAAGQDLDKSVKAMQGISTWAAISGQKTTEASRAIFNIAQAISTGYMGVADWKSIELANMATKDFKQNVIETAVELGKLTKETDAMGNAIYKELNGTIVSAEAMRETLKDKWFDSSVMINVLDKYGGYADKLGQVYSAMGEEIPTSKIIADIEKLGKGQASSIKYTGKAAKLMNELKDEWDDVGAKSFAAAQMAKTYQDAIEATKDATSTAWANLFEEIFGNFDEAKVYWTNFANDLWEVFVPRVIDIKDLMSEAFGRDTALFDDILAASKLNTDQILTNLKAVGVEAGVFTQEFANSADSIEALNVNGVLTSEMFSDAIGSLEKGIIHLTKTEDGNIKRTYESINATKEQKKSIRSIVKDIEINKESYEELLEAYATKTGREYMFDSIHNVLQSISAISDKLSSGWMKIFPTSGGKIYNILIKMASATESFLNKLDTDEVTSKIEGIGKGLASIFKIVGNIIKPVLSGLKKIADALGISSEKIFGAADNIGYLLQGIANATENMEWLNATFDALASVVSAVIKPVKDLFSYLNREVKLAQTEGEQLHPIFTNIKKTGEGINAVFRIASAIFTKVASAIGLISKSAEPSSSAIETIANAIFTVTGKIGELLTFIADLIESSDWLQKVFGYVGVAVNFVINVFSGFIEIATEIFKTLFGGSKDVKNFGNKAKSSSGGIEKFTEAASNALDVFKEWKNNVVGNISKVFSKIGSVFGMIGAGFNKVKEWLAPIGEYLASVFGPIWHNFTEWITNLNFKDVKDITMWLQTLLNGGLLGGLIKAITKMFDSITKGTTSLTKIGKPLEDFINKIGGGLTKALESLANRVNSEAIYNIAKSVVMLAGAMALLSFLPLDKLTIAGAMLIGLIEGLAGAFTMLSKAFSRDNSFLITKQGLNLGGITSALNSMAESVKIKAVKDFAIALAIMAGAVATLAIIAHFVGDGTVLMVGGVISGMAISLAYAMKLLSSAGASTKDALSSWKDVIPAVKGFLSSISIKMITASLLDIVVAIGILTLIAHYDLDNMMVAISVVAGIIGTLALLMIGLGKIKYENVIKAGAAVAIIGKTLLNVVAAISVLTLLAHIDMNAMMAATGMLGALLVVIGGVIAGLSFTANRCMDGAASLAVISAFLFSLATTIGALTIIIHNTSVNDAFAAAGVIGSLITVLGGVVAGLSFAGTRALAAAGALSIISSTLLSIAGVIAILTSVLGNDTENGLKNAWAATGIFAAIMVVIGGVIAGLAMTGNKALLAASSIIIVATAMNLLAGTLILMGTIGFVPVIMGIAGLAATLIVLAGAGYLLSPVAATLLAVGAAVVAFGAGITLTGAGVFMLASGIALLTGNIMALGEISADTARQAGTAIISFINGIAAGFPELLSHFGDTIKMLFAKLVEIMPQIGAFVTSLIGTILEAIMTNIPKIAQTILELFIAVLGLVNQNISTIAGLLVEIVVNLIKGVASKVDQLVVAVMDLFMAVMKGFAESLSRIDFDVFDEALLAIGSLAAIIALLATVSATAPLALIGTVMMAAILAEMNILVPGLVTFSNNLEKGHFNGRLVNQAATAIAILTAAAMAMPRDGGLLGAVLGSAPKMSEFAKDLVDMAPHLNKFAETLQNGAFAKGENRKLVKAGAKSIEFLASAANMLPKSGGLAQLIAGTSKSMILFAADLDKMGPSLVSFCEQVADSKFSDDLVEKGANAIKTLAVAADALPKNGGVVQAWTGDVSLIEFAAALDAMGPSLVGFSDELNKGNFDVKTVQNGAFAIKTLAEAANALPNKDGAMEYWLGNKESLLDFSEMLEDIAPNLVAFSNKIKGKFDGATSNQAANCLKTLAEAAREIPREDGVFSWFVGNRDSIQEFTKGLTDVAEEMVNFSTKSKNIDKAGLDNGVAVIKVFKELTDNLPDTTSFATIMGFKDKNVDLDEFGGQIARFINSYSDMAKQLNDSEIADLSKLNEAIKAMELFTKFGETISNFDIYGLGNFNDAMRSMGTTGIDTFIDTFDNNAGERAVNKAKWFIGRIIAGILESQTDLNTNFEKIFEKMFMSPEAASVSKMFHNAGVNYVQGFINGINEKYTDVRNAGTNIGGAVDEAVRERLDINSPSVEGLMTGSYYGTGLTLGLSSKEEEIKKEGTKLADKLGIGVDEGINNGSPKTKGELYDDKLAAGIIENGHTVKDAGASVGKSAAESTKEAYKTNLGSFIGDAISQGLGKITKPAGMPDNLWSDVVENNLGDQAKKKAEESGTETGNTFTNSTSNAVGDGSSKIKSAVEKKVIPAFNFAKSKKFRKTIKNAGKELTKAYQDSIKVFGDKKLKMASKDIEKLSKSLAKYYNKNSAAFKSDKKQMTNILAHLEYLEKKKERLIKQSEKLTKKYQDEAEAAVAAGDASKVLQLTETYKAEKKVLDKKISRTEKDVKYTNKVKQSYIDSAEALGKTAYYQKNLKKGAYEYTNVYKAAQKSITSTMNLTGSAKKSVDAYITSLYKETDAYSTDQEELETATQNYKNVRKELKALKKQRDKLITKGGSKKDINANLKEIADKEKELLEAGQEMEDIAKQIEENVSDAFEEVFGTVRQNIEDGFDILKRSFETGIDLINVSIENSSSKVDISSAFATGASKKTNIIDVLTASAETGIDIFSKFSDSATESTKSLLRNMKSQIEGFDNIAAGLLSLKDRGVSDDMLEYIKSMGTQAASYIKVFGRMSSEQIAEANKWFAESKKRSAETLITNMRETFEAKSKYDANIESLIARGLNDDIIKAIKEKGIEDQQMLKDYMNLTDDQIREANSWYQKSKVLEIEAKTKNVQDQLDEEITALEKWNSDIDSLMSSGIISDAWIEQIKEAGPKSRDILDAFMSMSESEIIKMNNRLADLNARNAKSTADALLDAQKSKIEDYAKYQEKMGELLSRTGIGEAMRKSLSSLTINDMDKINAYLSMSDSQIEQSNALFEKEAEYTKDALVQSYNNSIDETKKWVDELVKLGDTMGPEIVDGMMNMGMESSSAYIEAFKRMSPEEQREIGEAYKNKTDLSNTTMAALVLMMANKGKQTGEAYKEGAKEGASGTMDGIVDGITGDTDGAKDAGTNTADGVADGITAQTKTIKAAGKKAGKAMANGIKESKDKIVQAMSDNIVAIVDKAKSYNDEFQKRGRVMAYKIQTGFEAKREELLSSVGLTIDSITSAFSDRSSDFRNAGSTAGASITSGLKDSMSIVYNESVTAGNNLIQGLIIGVTDETYVSQLNKSLKRVMKNALQAAKDEAGIHSPSRVAAEIGKFIDLGLAQGITSYASKVIESTEELSDMTLTGLSAAMKNLANTVETEIDTTPVIRPVMDLSEVQDSISILNGELQNGYNIGQLYGKANSLSSRFNANRASKMSTADALQNLQASLGENVGECNITYDNTFNITGDNPREIANQVSRILQQQVDRKGAVWA